MKKVLLKLSALALLLTCSVGMWAQPTPVYADSYDNISQWYTVSFHLTHHCYMYYENGIIKFARADSNPDTSDASYKWAFVGDPINGFQIYNKKAGNTVALDKNDPCGMSASGTTCKWYLYESAKTTDGFCIKAEGDGQYANLQGLGSNGTITSETRLSRWKGADEGSTVQIFFPPITLDEAVNNNAIQLKTLRGTLYSDGTMLKAMKSGNPDNALFAIIQSDNDNYYLYNIATKKFVTYNLAYKDKRMETSADLASGIMKSMEVATDGTESNPYRFHFQDYYLNIDNKLTVYISDWKTADDGNRFQLIDNGKYDLSDAIAAVESYESPTKTLTDYGYATLFTDHAVAIPDGATAYYVTVDGTTATLNEIEGVIPANTGVVVTGTASSDYQFEYTTAAATTDVRDNQMTGFIVDTPITGDDAISYYAVNYKTVNSEKVPGFFAPKGATTSTGNFTAKAGKAYLKVEGAAGSSIVMRFGDATMVENLLKTQDAAIYDLTGRKVAQPERGIYIVNGKKMFFK